MSAISQKGGKCLLYVSAVLLLDFMIKIFLLQKQFHVDRHKWIKAVFTILQLSSLNVLFFRKRWLNYVNNNEKTFRHQATQDGIGVALAG